MRKFKCYIFFCFSRASGVGRSKTQEDRLLAQAVSLRLRHVKEPSDEFQFQLGIFLDLNHFCNLSKQNIGFFYPKLDCLGHNGHETFMCLRLLCS